VLVFGLIRKGGMLIESLLVRRHKDFQGNNQVVAINIKEIR
jgi:hypothetical protein